MRSAQGSREWNEELVSRDEVVALPFEVNDIAEILRRIERLLEDDGEEEDSEG